MSVAMGVVDVFPWLLYSYRALVGATSPPANQDPSTMAGKLAHTGKRLTVNTVLSRVNNSREGECLTVYWPV